MVILFTVLSKIFHLRVCLFVGLSTWSIRFWQISKFLTKFSDACSHSLIWNYTQSECRLNGESSGLKIICSFAYETRKEVMRVKNVGSIVNFLEVNMLTWLCN